MKLPTRLELEGRSWKIIRRRSNQLMVGGYPQMGEATDTHITLDPDTPLDAQRVTISHEMLHALCRRAGISRAIIKKTQEEYIVSKLESWLVVALQDNPEIVAFLTQR